MTRRLRLGPGLIVTAAFIGPGTVTTATLAGAHYGVTLLWALAFATVATIILQEMSVRLGLVTHAGLAQALRAVGGPRWLGPTLAGLAAVAVVSGVAAYQAGNLTGAGLGLEATGALTRRQWALGSAVGVVLLLWTGRYRVLERTLIGCVAIMGLVFLATAFLVAPSLGSLVRGAVVPTLPPGAGTLTALGLVGTTIVPYNLFLHAAAALEKWPGREDLASARWDRRRRPVGHGHGSPARPLARALGPARLRDWPRGGGPLVGHHGASRRGVRHDGRDGPGAEHALGTGAGRVGRHGGHRHRGHAQRHPTAAADPLRAGRQRPLAPRGRVVSRGCDERPPAARQRCERLGGEPGRDRRGPAVRRAGGARRHGCVPLSSPHAAPRSSAVPLSARLCGDGCLRPARQRAGCGHGGRRGDTVLRPAGRPALPGPVLRVRSGRSRRAPAGVRSRPPATRHGGRRPAGRRPAVRRAVAPAGGAAAHSDRARGSRAPAAGGDMARADAGAAVDHSLGHAAGSRESPATPRLPRAHPAGRRDRYAPGHRRDGQFGARFHADRDRRPAVPAAGGSGWRNPASAWPRSPV
ncbi:MAG: Nramp family divalent metal transporter [Gemmatimonadetes bacterium]|nr:Nramp family divalent metal transporter [Gemmatimonadota bacterium]